MDDVVIDEEAADAFGLELEVLQRDFYYPFGLSMEGAWIAGSTDDPRMDYRYNGKELSQVTGLMAYGARYYDPAIARWNAVDLLADWAPDLTPYRYGFNNPILFTDPDGLFEKKRHARRYKRKSRTKDVRKGKIKKNENGRYSIRFGENGSITQNTEGDIEHASVATYTGSSIKPYKTKMVEKVRDANFMTGMAYGILDDGWLFTQRYNPFDTHTTHLSGHYASKDEYTMAMVNTAASVVPAGRSATAVKSLTPEGLTLLRRLNAAQFSKRFKGTLAARTHPRIRGKLNRLLNKGVDQVNNRTQTGNVVFQGNKAAGKQANKDR